MYSKLIQFVKINPFRFVLIIFSILVLKELIYIQTFRGKASPIADGYSEANTSRGGLFFYEKGITAFAGLPNIIYGDLLLGTGVAPSDKKYYDEGGAYTHYPPGPEYMAWLGYHLVGKGNFNGLRYIPIFFSILIGLFFIRTNFELIGGGTKGVLFILALILPPLYSNFMHGLHHQQYAFLMLQLQMAMAILFITKKVNKPLYLLAFFALGFAQGYMTFDYAFLASLFVIPFFIYLNANFSVLFLIGLPSGLGFTTAHLLHFYQVVNYYGDLKLALADFTDSAAHRSHNAVGIGKANPKYNPDQIGPFTVWKDYLYRVSGRGKYLAINLMNFIWIILGLKFIKKITFKKGWSFEFEITGRDVMALASAAVISGLWSIVMKQHAHIHGFIARHYFFAYYFCCLILISRTKRVS
jgi:hypothetical protein